MATAMDDSESFKVACYTLSALVLISFGIGAVYLTTKTNEAATNTTAFITARKSQPLKRVAWSFYASSIGAWAVFLPAAYTTFGGYVSIMSYSIATGLPLVIIAYWGNALLKNMPHVVSLSDFAGKRYGHGTRVFVIILSIFNMCIALIAEYTAIGDLFEFYVGTSRVGIVLLVAVITSIYTAAGGLLVSIWTDQGQAILSLLFILVASLYLIATFKHPLVSPLPENLGANYAGFSSIAALPISVLSSCIYSEAFWQRVWAAEDPRSLHLGSIVGFALTTIVIAFFGFVGFLGGWANLPPLDDYGNLAFFVPFVGSKGNWVAVVLVLLAVTMNESAVDSLQNAIVATLSSNFLVEKPVSYSRILVFLINIPITVISLQGYGLLDIFLISNILCTTSMLPLISGIFLNHVSQLTVLGSCFFSFLCTCLFGCLYKGDFQEGMRWTFSSTLNQYDYRIFLVALGASVVGLMVGSCSIDRNSRKVRWGSLEEMTPIS